MISLTRVFMVLFFLSAGMAANTEKFCHAQGAYDIRELTPEIKAALDSRRGRFDLLRSFKQKGILGENNQGYVAVLVPDDQADDLADAENRDRKFIYTKIVEQNSLPKDALGTVEKIFAQVQRDKASPGDKIQAEGGQWMTK